MKRNENGIAVPGEPFTLPLRVNTAKGTLTHITDVVGLTVTPVVYTVEMAEFLREAANFHERFGEIVRKLAEWHDQDDDTIDILPIVTDAADLWEEYREEAK